MINKLLMLICCVFMFCGWTYHEGFESGSDDALATGSNGAIFSDGTKAIYFENSDAKVGSQCGRCEFTEGLDVFSNGPKAKIDNINHTIQAGDEFWMTIYIKTVSSWSWNDNEHSNVDIKIFRAHKKESDSGNNNGYNSIFGVNDGDTVYGRAYINNEYVPSGYGNIGKWSDKASTWTDDVWHKIDYYWKANTSGSSNGIVSWYFDDVLIKQENSWITIGTGASNTWVNGRVLDFCYIWSYWNQTPDITQTALIDEVYVSNEKSYDDYIGGGSDTTAPSASSFDPAQGATGVSLTKDPFVSFTISDAGDGVDSESVVLTVAGNDESSDLSWSGNTSQMNFYLSNSNVNESIDYGETYAITIDADDLATNSMAQVTYNISTEVTPSGGTSFGTGATNDSANYTERSASWEIVNDADACYRIDNTVYSPTGKGGLGEYAYYNGAAYSEFRLEAQVKSNEADVSESAYADYDFIFGYEDDDNYFFCMFNSDSESNGVYQITAGDEYRIEEVTRSGVVINDNDWHDVTIEYENSVLNVYHDEYGSGITPIFTSSSIDLTQSGYVGIGGYNDQASFDDITITDLGNPDPPVPTPEGDKTMSGSGTVTMSGTDTITIS